MASLLSCAHILQYYRSIPCIKSSSVLNFDVNYRASLTIAASIIVSQLYGRVGLQCRMYVRMYAPPSSCLLACLHARCFCCCQTTLSHNTGAGRSRPSSNWWLAKILTQSWNTKIDKMFLFKNNTVKISRKGNTSSIFLQNTCRYIY